MDLVQLFMAGKRNYEGLDFPACIDEMTQIIDAIQEKLDSTQGLLEGERIYYPRALEYRALAAYNLADEESARADFERLIEFSPGHVLAEQLASPLILDFFNGVRRALVGRIRLLTEPEGAAVLIDGVDAGISNIESHTLLSGSHSVEVRLRGYLPAHRVVEIRADETAEVSVRLERSTASIFVRTSPPGAEVMLDGEVVGVTSGVAGSDYADAAAELGLSLSQISAELIIPYVELGTHQLAVKKECFSGSRFRVAVEEAVDLYLPKPIVLGPSLGDLALAGVPTDARVFLNGVEHGRGQTTFEHLCSGEYLLEVIHPAGSFRGKTVVYENRKSEFKVTLRPALVYIGAEFRGLLDEELQSVANEKLAELFDSLTAFQPVVLEGENARKLADEGLIPPRAFGLLVTSTGMPEPIPPDLYQLVRKTCRSLNASLLAVAVFQERRLGLKFRIFLFGTSGALADSFVVDLDDPAGMERASQRLNYDFSFERSWLGITAVDTRIHVGTAVIAVMPGSPAAEAGVEAGSVISAVEGNPVSGYRQVITAIESKRPGDMLELELVRGDERRTIIVSLGRSPRLLPLFSQSFSYNAAIAVMRLTAALNQGTEREQFALFNTGLALAHFGDWENAITFLRRVQLGDAAGINQGTVEYFLGFCFENLGYSAEAISHYRRALEYRTATFDSNDGPLIGPRVRRKVQQLGEAP